MILLTAVQAADTFPSSQLGMLGFWGALIGIYTARRIYGKASFRQLPTGAIILGAGFGVLLLTLLLFVALLKAQDASTAESFGRWLGWGIGGSLFIGGPAAFIAGRSKSAKPAKADSPSP